MFLKAGITLGHLIAIRMAVDVAFQGGTLISSNQSGTAETMLVDWIQVFLELLGMMCNLSGSLFLNFTPNHRINFHEPSVEWRFAGMPSLPGN